MKWSQTHLYTLKESPADAEIESHKLLVRSGFIKKLAPGLFTYGAMALRSLRKFEAILRQELEKVGCVEVLMPVVQPKEIWQETGRWTTMGDGLLKFKNRNQHEFCLGATHEEAVTDYIRHDIKSYRDLPKIIYQVQTKYRDEIRPRFGLMRGREFIMKDAYSFDLSQEAAHDSYEKMYQAYQNIFNRLGLDYRVVQADSGSIGGDKSHEFHVLAESGEDHLLVEEGSDYAANSEVCMSQPSIAPSVKATGEKMAEIETKGIRTIESLSSYLNVPANHLVKTMFFDISSDPKKHQPIAVLVLGDDEVNPVKIKNLLKLDLPPEPINEAQVKALTGAMPGSCGPVNLKCDVYMDKAVESLPEIVVGANKDDIHLKNVVAGRDFKVKQVADFRLAKPGDKGPNGGTLKSYRGIEVGHVFYLGNKYSKAMNANYLDANGKSQIIEMGCYGIGVGRTVQAAIEQNHDKDGMIWPMALAPFHVHICHLDPADESANEKVEALNQALAASQIDVFIDERKARPGVKFKDADLLGFPVRVTAGKRGLENGVFEVVVRKSKAKHEVEISKAAEFIQNLVRELNEQ
ncbi:MAG: proline--tRNA ligase [Bdellovibrionales bacterium]|nr:proline--tRNA ligase [Bdellovibrionales bacterium]